jgi:hypothetical protein
MKRLSAAMKPADTGVAGHPWRMIDIIHTIDKAVAAK